MAKEKKDTNERYNKLIDLALQRSIFYPSAEIYPNSPAGFFDFGPLGQAIRRKIINLWRHELVNKEHMLEISGSQILPESVFIGSGHLKSFADPIVQCVKCKKFERADQLISEEIGELIPESAAIEKLDELIKKHHIKCPKCKGELSKVKKFNMMVETIVGKTGEFKTFLRPEACQSIFLNFQRMVKTMRMKLPQGIAQAGGAFRNEISPRQMIIRAVEFAQMEAEVFFDPEKINDIENFEDISDYKVRILLLTHDKVSEFTAKELFEKKIVPGKLIAYYLARTQQTFHAFGIPLEKMRFREVDKDERAFYSLATFDLEIETCVGWLEVSANNYRTDYDLSNHMKSSGANLEYVDEFGKHIIPHIFEISSGIDRTLFAVLDTALKEGKEGSYFALDSGVSPYDCAVLPLVNKEGIPALAKKVEQLLHDNWIDVFYDSSASIGRRYARQDEIGTPICITVDFDSLKNHDATIRDRDTTDQVRVKIDMLSSIIRDLRMKKISIGGLNGKSP